MSDKNKLIQLRRQHARGISSSMNKATPTYALNQSKLMGGYVSLTAGAPKRSIPKSKAAVTLPRISMEKPSA